MRNSRTWYLRRTGRRFSRRGLLRYGKPKSNNGRRSQYLPCFVEELRRNSELGLLQVVSSSQTDADILITLWKPVPLLRMLAEMDVGFAVSQTANGTEVGSLRKFQGGPEDRTRVVLVRLTANPDSH